MYSCAFDLVSIYMYALRLFRFHGGTSSGVQIVSQEYDIDQPLLNSLSHTILLDLGDTKVRCDARNRNHL